MIYAHFKTHGLCNRLRAFTALVVLAARKSEKFAFSWMPDSAFPGKFEDSMVSPFRQVPADKASVQALRAKVGRNNFFGGKRGANSAARSLHAYWSRFFRPLGMSLDDALRQQRLAQKLITLQPHLEARVCSVSDQFEHRTLGLHVRRTDLLRKQGAGRRATADDILRDAVDRWCEQNPDGKIFLAADNPKSVEMLITRYGGRILRHDIKWQPSRRQTTAQDSVVELYTLARTSRIIGTMGSSFSYYAAGLGDIDVERI